MLCRCPAYAGARNGVFGSPDPPLTVLRTAPHKVVRFLDRIGRLTTAQSCAAAEHDEPPPSPGAAGAAPVPVRPESPVSSR